MSDQPHHCQTPRFDTGNPLAERGIRRSLWLTAVMMVIEIAGGWWFNSMAVLADGWHMSSHTVALGLSAQFGLLAVTVYLLSGVACTLGALNLNRRMERRDR